MKKYFKGFLLGLLVILSESLIAGELMPITGILRTTPGNIVTIDSASAEVEIYVDTIADVADYNVRNLISLNFDNNTDTFLTAFTRVRVVLTIERWDHDGNAMTNETADLTVNSNNRYFRQTIDKDLLKLVNGYRVKVTIDSIFINDTSKTILPRFVYIESEIDLARYYDFSSIAEDTITGITGDPLNTDCDADSTIDELNINWSTVIGAEEYQLEWAYVNNYGTTDSTYYSLSQLSVDFKHNSTRITTAANEYKISMIYEKGYIVYRVRAVGRDYLDPEVSIYGVWSAPDVVALDDMDSDHIYYNTVAHEKEKNWQYSATFAEEGKKKEVVSYFDGSLHNRQSVTKVNSDKNAIVGETIYDHQGRPAVNVLPVPVNFPSCSTSYEESSLKYYENFNRNLGDSSYTKLDFDLDNDGECIPLIAKMDTTSGASQYYSPFNPDKSYQQAFLPDAEMYPFSMVEYTPDNTGRIRNQSGVGKEFQIGEGHETKYLYGQPNQLQLDRLFGSEAGDATHYKKNVVIDANGQTSISYLNQEGKTVATSLAGDPPTDTSGVFMEALPSEASAADTLTLDLFNKDANGISQTNKVTPLQDGIEFSTQLLVPFTSTYDFTYDLMIDTLADSCLRENVCLSCIYDFSIKILNECGEDITYLGTEDSTAISHMVGHFNVLDTVPYYEFVMTCASSDTTTDSSSISLTLTPGVYTVSKTLTINQEAKTFYVTNFLDSTYNSCIKTLSDFVAEGLAGVDTTDCYPTCETCAAALGTRDDFVASGQGTELQYDILMEQCLAPCKERTLCENSFEMMLIDVSPGGQYGGFNPGSGTSSDNLSVFNLDNYLNGNIWGIDAHWKSPRLKLNGYTYDIYLEDDGNRKKVMVEDDPASSNYLPPVDDVSKVYTDVSTGDLFTYPENLSNLSDFIPVWSPRFARSLVVYHPEYVYFMACSDHAVTYSGDTLSSDNFDSLFIATETFDQAVTRGFIIADYDSTGIAPNDKVADLLSSGTHQYDPFFTNNDYVLSFSAPDSGTIDFDTSEIHDVMRERFDRFFSAHGIDYSMIEVAAILARCGNNFSATPTADCMAFGTDRYSSVVSGYIQKNDSIRNMEWRFLKNFYLSEKRKIQYSRMEFYSKYYNWGSGWSGENWYGGCNACIGNGSYSPASSGMYSPGLPGTYPASPFYSHRQPCSWYSWNRYSNVQKRFISPANSGLNPATVPYMIYQETGQCPMAFQLQQFLNGMSQGHLLTDTVNMNSVSSFSPDLYTALNDGADPSLFINYQWQKISIASDLLTVNIVSPVDSSNACTVKLDINSTAIPSFDSILTLTNLTFDYLDSTGLFHFNASVSYTDTGTVFMADITGSSCLNIKDCVFDPVCTPNQFASDMQILFSVMQLNGHLKSTTYNISADTMIAPVITATVKNMLGSPNNNLRWNYTATNKFELYDFANPTTKLKFTFLTSSPSASYVDTAIYFDNMRSYYNNLFKMDGMDSEGNVVVALQGKAEKIVDTVTSGISMGECGFPDAVDCSTTEHQVREDLEVLLNEFLVTTPFDGTVNLFETVNFTLLLQSFLPATLTTTTSIYDSSSTYASSHDTLTFDMDGACTFEIYRHISDPGAHGVNFPDMVAVTDLTGVPPMDEQGSFHDFYFIATFDSAGTFFSDTIRGTSCWPIKNCNHCDTNTVTPVAFDSNTVSIPLTYMGWGPVPETFDAIDTSECQDLYDSLLVVLQNYNSSVYATYHSDTLDENIYPTFDFFMNAGYCNCIDSYLDYLVFYLTEDTTSTEPLPDDIDHYSECTHTTTDVYLDQCKILHTKYSTARTAYNNYVAAHPSLNYPTIDTLYSSAVFNQYFCNCALKFLANIGAIINGYNPDSTTVSGMVDIRQTCETAPCVPEAPDTAFVFPPFNSYVSPCVAQMMSVAILNAQNQYTQYIDSATTSIASRYTEHCLQAAENFNYRYTDKEYHYTLYYYDQAGNLVKTIPPEGVKLLAIDSTSDELSQKIIADRTNSTQTVFTSHGLPTTYEYNSLNQLVNQSMPDHDNMDLIEFSLPNGLDSRFRTNRMKFVNGGKGYLSGYVDLGSGATRGYLYTTANGGNNWSRVNNTVAANINDVFFASSTVGYAACDDGVILKTTNGGSSWDAKNLNGTYTGNFFSVYFNTTTDGFIGAAKSATTAGIYFTTSGGISYAAATGFSNGDTITGITKDGTYYYASVKNAGEGKLYRSTDGGNTWLPLTVIRANDLKKVQYVNFSGGYIAFAVGTDGTLLKTTTASASSWAVIPNRQSKSFRDIYFLDDTQGIAIIDSVTDKGQIFKTFDGGLSWELLSEPGEYYSSLQAYTANKVLASGENGLISKVVMTVSPFGMIKLDKPSFVNDLKYADAVLNEGAGQAVAVGNNDTIYYTGKTDTAYVNWTKIKTTSYGVASGDANFKKVLIKDTVGNNIKGILLTSNGKIYSFYKDSSNVFNFDLDSVTDLSSNPITNYFFKDITMDNHQSTKFYAYDTISKRAFTGTIGTSSTPLVTFVYMDTTTAQHNYVQSLSVSDDANHFLLAGDRGTIKYKSNPNSTTTTYSTRSYLVKPLPLNSIWAKTTDELYAAGEDGTMWNTNNGTTWRLLNTGITEDINKIRIKSGATTGAIACEDGKLFKQTIVDSLNITLTQIDLETTDDLTSLTLNDTIVYAGTSSGGIKHVSSINTNDYNDVNVSGMIGAFKGMAFVPSSSKVYAGGDDASMYQCLGDNSIRTYELFLPNIQGASFADANNGYIATTKGDIRHTTDGGNTWTVVKSVVTVINNIYTVQPDQAIAMGPSGYFGVINGNEVTNTLTASGSPQLTNIDFNQNGYGVMTGTARSVYNVMASGSSFTITSIGPSPAGSPTNYALFTVKVFPDNTFLVAGAQSRIYYYTGSTFVRQTGYDSLIPAPTSSKTIYDIYFHDDRTGYVVGSNGIALKCNLSANIMDGPGGSTDAITWDSLNLYDPFSIYNYSTKSTIDIFTIDFSDRMDGFVGGWYNTAVTNRKYAMHINDQSDYFSTRFFYDKLGRMVISQNSKQYNKSPKAFSYTKYDALGRIKEVGEKADNSSGTLFREIFGSYVNSFYNPKTIDNDSLESWIAGTGDRTEVTKTYYDTVTFSTIPLAQENLRKRVSDVTYEDLDDDNDSTYQHATHYTYDIHGNVSTLWQENPEISIAGQQMKRIDYEYDLISGKVNKVIYQPDSADMFIHKYDYDADNRITHVWTSPDDVIWQQDAKYFYYAHGPLARVELGHDKAQGIDYAYTLQGWIKGINSTTLNTVRDMGRDAYADTSNVNSLVNKDAFSYTLGYYEGDYKAIDRVKWNTVTNRFEAQTAGGEFLDQRFDLFNGNIGHMTATLSKIDTAGGGLADDQIVKPLVNAYKYDQLNRLKNSVAFDNIDIPNNLWEASGQAVANMYQNVFTYDANGNILTQLRRDSAAAVINNMTYRRHKDSGSDLVRNRLYHLDDTVSAGTFPDDIDDQGVFNDTAAIMNTANNYGYDEIGNLIRNDSSEVDTIKWTVYGKIKEVIRSSGSSKKNLKFDYDASGNRIAKHVYNSAGGWENSQYYTRDAQGNVMSVYKQDTVGMTLSYKLQEQHLYGSSRVGMTKPELEMIGAIIDTSNYSHIQNKKFFEGTNHLSNVLVTFSDRKIAVDTNSDLAVDFRLADLASTSDYYPFGVKISERGFNSDNHRYGFNGKEDDDETETQDYGMRIYDGDIGTFFSTDPIMASYPQLSPYQFASNNPIWAVDIDGLEDNTKTKPDVPSVPLPAKMDFEAIEKRAAQMEHHKDNIIAAMNIDEKVKKENQGYLKQQISSKITFDANGDPKVVTISDGIYEFKIPPQVTDEIGKAVYGKTKSYVRKEILPKHFGVNISKGLSMTIGLVLTPTVMGDGKTPEMMDRERQMKRQEDYIKTIDIKIDRAISQVVLGEPSDLLKISKVKLIEPDATSVAPMPSVPSIK